MQRFCHGLNEDRKGMFVNCSGETKLEERTNTAFDKIGKNNSGTVIGREKQEGI